MHRLIETGFENQRMSKEKSIKVDWAPSAPPAIAPEPAVPQFEDDGMRVTEPVKKSARHQIFGRIHFRSAELKA